MFAIQVGTFAHFGAQVGVREALLNPRAYASAKFVGFLNALNGYHKGELVTSFSRHQVWSFAPARQNGAASGHPVCRRPVRFGEL